MIVASTIAAQLKAEWQSVSVRGTQADRWPSQGATTQGLSPFADAYAAADEGARRAELRGAPHVRERAIVQGQHAVLFGRCINLVADGLGYREEGEIVFVIGVEELDNGTSTLIVVRALS